MNIRIIICLMGLLIFLMHATVAKDNKTDAETKRRPGGGLLSGQSSLSSLGGQNLLSLFSGQGLSSLFGAEGLISSFAHSRLNEVMSAATGVLAAIGGGYLLYVATVALYGNALGRPYGIRRESTDLFRQLKSLDYPDAFFNWLQIKDESCRMKAVCELQSYLSGNLVPSPVLEGISKRIPGMEKYLAASRRGLRKQSCHTQCRLSTGEMMMKAMGSWFHFS